MHAAHSLSRICPYLFLSQEKWVPQACRVLWAQEAPQVLKERKVPLVSVEPLEMLGKQVSDERSLGRPSNSRVHWKLPMLISSPSPSSRSGLALLGSGESQLAKRVHHWA